MISPAQVSAVGKLLKPHGINGEITVLRYSDDVDFDSLGCLVMDIDAILVPFFLKSVRPKGNETDLLSIDGVTDEMHAARLTNKTVYALNNELGEETADDADGLFADDLVGFDVWLEAASEPLGTVTDIDDSTANFLLVVETPDARRLLIPVADEFVTDLDPQQRRMVMSLPEGLLEMQ